MKVTKHLFFIIFFIGITNQSLAQVKKDTLSVLFVGNSYTYYSNMPHLVSLISDSTKVKLITSKSTAGGAKLSDHWNGNKGLKSKEAISSGKYDIVVLQGQSKEAVKEKEEFLMYSKKLSDLVKASGAKPYLYVTWAPQKIPQYQETITETFQQASKESDCGLVMVGEAWKLAKALRPDIQLFLPDGSHPSDLGAFLTACAFVKTFSKELPKSQPDRFFITDSDGKEVMIFRENSMNIEFCLKVIQNL
ncbi:hypothetical protein [Winogradskyella flava]|uniref:SGNH/GDSL hydrolase family protein n=1 Tax=Winogradskyella flava TaxID=1884876 RepID=A0A842IU96_9FLAO|nr:hypothetical protein [Winogradskyella flava]MBC2846742.1 hypothetical protein [Winogradskyella flava]